MEYEFDELAYIRRLQPQELGFRKGRPGGGGRYFLISKKAINFFPPLSKVALNDHVLLDIFSVNSDETVSSRYVYHNSKYATGPDGENRDEYRLYLNGEIDPGANFFKPNDIVVIVKLRVLEPETKELVNIFYKTLRYIPGSREYGNLDSILQEIAVGPKKSHALVPLSKLAFLDGLRRIKEVGKKVIPNEVLEFALKEPVSQSVILEEDKSVETRVLRSRSFRDLILHYYEYKCAVTGKKLLINYKDFFNLEAAHLQARAFGGGPHPSNGIAFERNLHWAFDKGFFTVTDDYRIKVHPQAMHVEYLKELEGKPVFLPQDSRSRPNLISLKWHRETVFGLFLRS